MKRYFSEEEFKTMLAYARCMIGQALGIACQESIEIEETRFLEKRGVFVTLKKEGKLRGCIGYIEPILSLKDVIRTAAVKAAFEDPRFPPLSPDEFEEIKIELSILMPPQILKELYNLEIGVHGLIIEKGQRRGLLLPSVPVEWGWDRQTFLSQVALKAGLGPFDWKTATLYTFTTETASEE